MRLKQIPAKKIYTQINVVKQSVLSLARVLLQNVSYAEIFLSFCYSRWQTGLSRESQTDEPCNVSTQKKRKETKCDSPNHEASSLVNAIGSAGSVSDWNVMAGNPRPMPDDKFEKLARMLIKICAKILAEKQSDRWWCVGWMHRIKQSFLLLKINFLKNSREKKIGRKYLKCMADMTRRLVCASRTADILSRSCTLLRLSS